MHSNAQLMRILCGIIRKQDLAGGSGLLSLGEVGPKVAVLAFSLILSDYPDVNKPPSSPNTYCGIFSTLMNGVP